MFALHRLVVALRIAFHMVVALRRQAVEGLHTQVVVVCIRVVRHIRYKVQVRLVLHQVSSC